MIVRVNDPELSRRVICSPLANLLTGGHWLERTGIISDLSSCRRRELGWWTKQLNNVRTALVCLEIQPSEEVILIAMDYHISMEVAAAEGDDDYFQRPTGLERLVSTSEDC
jgi:hypothetical protein